MIALIVIPSACFGACLGFIAAALCQIADDDR